MLVHLSPDELTVGTSVGIPAGLRHLHSAMGARECTEGEVSTMTKSSSGQEWEGDTSVGPGSAATKPRGNKGLFDEPLLLSREPGITLEP